MNKMKSFLFVLIVFLSFLLLLGNIVFAYLYISERSSRKDSDEIVVELQQSLENSNTEIHRLTEQLSSIAVVEGGDSTDDEVSLVYTTDKVSSDQVSVDITEPELLGFVYPSTWGDIELEGSDACRDLNDGRYTVSISFSNSDASLGFYSCGFGGGGYALYKSYNTQTKSGEKVTIDINEYNTYSDKYYVEGTSEDSEVFFNAEVSRASYEEDVQIILDLFESIELS